MRLTGVLRRISVVEDLKFLSKLSALDLSFNTIQVIPAGVLPPTLLFFNTKGNPFADMVCLCTSLHLPVRLISLRGMA